MPEQTNTSIDSSSPTSTSSTSAAPSTTSGQENAITQELVEKLADKVMRLLLDDLKNEAERYRLSSIKMGSRHSTFGTQGGR
jgi:hypothetical protein